MKRIRFFKFGNETVGFNIALTQNKTFEFQVAYWEDFYHIFNLSLDLRRKTDHAGIEFDFTILKASLKMSIVDNRHWDREKNCYESDFVPYHNEHESTGGHE